jgi:hypothetical protein
VVSNFGREQTKEWAKEFKENWKVGKKERNKKIQIKYIHIQNEMKGGTEGEKRES